MHPESKNRQNPSLTCSRKRGWEKGATPPWLHSLFSSLLLPPFQPFSSVFPWVSPCLSVTLHYLFFFFNLRLPLRSRDSSTLSLWTRPSLLFLRSILVFSWVFPPCLLSFSLLALLRPVATPSFFILLPICHCLSLLLHYFAPSSAPTTPPPTTTKISLSHTHTHAQSREHCCLPHHLSDSHRVFPAHWLSCSNVTMLSAIWWWPQFTSCRLCVAALTVCVWGGGSRCISRIAIVWNCLVSNGIKMNIKPIKEDIKTKRQTCTVLHLFITKIVSVFLQHLEST